jgi:kynurenine aminotransferase
MGYAANVLIRAAWFIAMEIGVSSIPVSDVRIIGFPNRVVLADVIRSKFYCDEHVSLGENYLRFSFCKDLDTLRAAVERLQKLKKYLA